MPGPEAVEIADRGVAVGRRCLSVVTSSLSRVIWASRRSGCRRPARAEPGLEFLAQVGVGPGAVEGGPVDGGLAGEGLDVALAAGRDVAAQEPVDGGPDPVLVLLALVGADAHYCWAPFWLVAASMAVQDAPGAVVVGLQPCLLCLAGRAEIAEEGLRLAAVLGPDGPVAGVVGGLRAAGGVAHSGERPVGGGGPGELEAKCPGRVGEPVALCGPWRPVACSAGFSVSWAGPAVMAGGTRWADAGVAG